MLYRNGRQWELCPFKIVYIQYNERFEQYSNDKKWWLDFVDMWGHTQIIEIIEVEYMPEQLARYEEIKYMPEDFSNMYSDYVENGSFPNNEDLQIEHPFRMIQLRKEGEQQGVELSQREINEIMHGIQLTDLEIRLLIGGL